MTPVVENNAVTHGQAEARPFAIVWRMTSLKEIEDSLVVLGGDADAVVCEVDRAGPMSRIFVGRNP